MIASIQETQSAVPQFPVLPELTETEYRAELRAQEVEWFKSVTKHEENDEIIDRLVYYAEHKPLKYEHLREYAGGRLGCRATSLDRVIEQRRTPKPAERKVTAEKPPKKDDSKVQGSAVLCPDVEPWPGSVDGSVVLNEVATMISNRVVLPEGAADAIALWCAHTYCFDQFPHSPRLNITSPEKGCGKSTLREVIALLVNRPLCLDSLTTAVTFRLLDKHQPTLLADEADSWLRENEELRGALNAGHSSNGLFARCEGDGNEVRTFKVFAPAALCGIGNLPGTLHDRSIVIRLKRAKPGELQVSKPTGKEKELARKLSRFCLDNRDRLAACDPKLPDGVFNRLADNWRPLFAISEIVGGNWPERCAAALINLTSQDDADVETQKVMLLADIREVIADQRLQSDHWIESGDLIDLLIANPERPWNDAKRGKPINAQWLGVRLKAFGIKPGKLPRDGQKQRRGYNVAAFRDAFDRYLPVLGVTCGQLSQQPLLRGEIGETDAETDSETDANSVCVSAIHEGKIVSETDVQLRSGNRISQ